MKQKFLAGQIVSAHTDALTVNWIFGQQETSEAIIVVSDDETGYVGVITGRELYYARGASAAEAAGLSAGQICDKNYPISICSENDDIYASVRNLMADDPSLNFVPVLDEQRRPVDIFSRRRAFYLDYYERGDLPYMYYGHIIKKALHEARALDYEGISVLDFGLACGNSHVACNFHAQELARIYGLKVQVYGFDSGEGLPPVSDGAKDMSYLWEAGLYKGNMEKLARRLPETQLVIGWIEETVPSFLEKYRPAPIGAVIVDVDLYSSTIPILELLDQDYQYVMPRIHMYFDDIMNLNEFAGETLAVKDFNASRRDTKISPENCSVGRPEHKIPNIKVCHNFKHPLYNRRIISYPNLHLHPTLI